MRVVHRMKELQQKCGASWPRNELLAMVRLPAMFAVIVSTSHGFSLVPPPAAVTTLMPTSHGFSLVPPPTAVTMLSSALAVATAVPAVFLTVTKQQQASLSPGRVTVALIAAALPGAAAGPDPRLLKLPPSPIGSS